MPSIERPASLTNPYAGAPAETGPDRRPRGAGRALVAAVIGLGALASLVGTASAGLPTDPGPVGSSPADGPQTESAPTVEIIHRWSLEEPERYRQYLAQTGLTDEQHQRDYQLWLGHQDQADAVDGLLRLWSDANGLTGFDDVERTDIPSYAEVSAALSALSADELREVRTVGDIAAVVAAADVEQVPVPAGFQDPAYVSPGLRAALEAHVQAGSPGVPHPGKPGGDVAPGVSP